MRIGILEAGVPPRALVDEHGRYDAMTARLLGPDFATTSFRVQEGGLPARPEDFDGYVVTGSSAGVYDDLPWIAPLRAFLQVAKGRAKLVGICFGHQIMAEAFGGRVVKSDKGWGLGLQRYEVKARADWMDEARTIAIPASHQDQVVALPPGARVLARNDFRALRRADLRGSAGDLVPGTSGIRAGLRPGAPGSRPQQAPCPAGPRAARGHARPPQ